MNYVIHDTGLDITSPLTLGDFANLLEGFRQGEDQAKWIQADLLAYGDDKFGESMYQAIDTTNWTPAKVGKYVRTAKNMPRAVRRSNVAFWNHYELIGMSDHDRDYALDKLASHEMSRDDLRNYKRELKGEEIPNEQTITLKWEQMQVRDGKLIVVFTAPLDPIVEFKAVVRKPAIKDKAA